MTPDHPMRRKTDRPGTIVITQRGLFVGIAIVLAVLLAVLTFFLVRALTGPSTALAADEVAGIQPVFMLEGPGAGSSPLFDGPMGVAVGKDDRIYVTDSGNNRVCVFSSRGKFLFEFGGFGVAKPLPGGRRSWEPGKLNYPVGIDCDEEGNVYVADFRNDQIQVFDPDGAYIARFPDPAAVTGKGGSGQDGTGIAVTDVCVRNGRVYATDRYQVFVFSTKGEVIGQFGKPGGEPGDLDHPNGVCVTDGGVLYVSDSNHGRVTAFSQDGKVLWNFGVIPSGPEATQTGPLGLPRGLTVGRDGDVIVADAFQFALMSVNRNGDAVRSFGARGSTPGMLNFPNDVEVLDDKLVVADKGNDRVQVVRLVQGAGE